MSKQIHVCTHCGSPRVSADAWVGINDPEHIQTFDNCFCHDCEGECKTEEVTVPDDFDLDTDKWREAPEAPALRTYLVTVTRNITESCLLTVQARDEDQAEEIAFEVACFGEVDWQIDDGSQGAESPFVTDITEEPSHET